MIKRKPDNLLSRLADRLVGPNALIRRLPRLVTHVDLKHGVAFSARIYDPKKTDVHPDALISHRVVIQNSGAHIYIGAHTQVNYNTVILGGNEINIGRYVMIGPNCTIAAGDHDYRQTDRPMRFAGTISKSPIVIEDDVWLGAGVVVTDGVTIGQGAVIGAGAVVTQNIPAMAIAGGVPARIIGHRTTVTDQRDAA